ncbi:MAG: hypothetical protein EPN91_09220 [Salinibacterium sp.]|nr:MAG: hypothetical protein EPN91_09220 [Salinibacterium sp.]
MALANYGDLKTAVGTWLNRADLAAYIPDFVTLGASRIYYGSKDTILPSPPVRTWSMQTSESPTVSAASFALPARYVSTILLRGSDGSSYWTIDYKSPSTFAEDFSNTGHASFYTILDNAIQLSGSQTTSIKHYYYQSFAAFSADGDTNALLTAAPSLWLWATILEANIFIGDDDGAKKAHRMFMSIATGLNANANEHGGGTLAMVAR